MNSSGHLLVSESARRVRKSKTRRKTRSRATKSSTGTQETASRNSRLPAASPGRKRFCWQRVRDTARVAPVAPTAPVGKSDRKRFFTGSPLPNSERSIGLRKSRGDKNCQVATAKSTRFVRELKSQRRHVSGLFGIGTEASRLGIFCGDSAALLVRSRNLGIIPIRNRA